MEEYTTEEGVRIKEGYYLAGCKHCGWKGCSSECGTDYCGGDDSDVYCPACNMPGADSYEGNGEFA